MNANARTFSRQFSGFRTLLLIAAFTCAGSAATAWAAASRALTSDQVASADLPPEGVSRQVNIDGRFVTLRISVIRVFQGNIPENSRGWSTEARVSLSIQDGAPLPAGLKVTRVRFERFFGSSRVFYTPVTQIDSPSTGVFELDQDDFRGDLGRRADGARRLKALVRLEMNGRVFRVDMGTLPVSNAGPTQ